MYEAYMMVVGAALGVGTVVLVGFGLHWCVVFALRWFQAGRKGYGFEDRGVQRIRTAAWLFFMYDMGQIDWQNPERTPWGK